MRDGRVTGREFLERRNVEAIGRQRTDDVAAQRRVPPVVGTVGRDVPGHGDGDPRRQLRQLVGVVCLVADGLAAIHREGGNIVFAKKLHLVVAEDHGNVRAHALEHFRKRPDRAPAGRVLLAPGLGGYLLRDVLAGAQRHQFLERVRAALVGVRAVGLVRDHALPPLLRGRGKHGTMGCSHPQHDLRHDCSSAAGSG
jgi:hypothetical protein